MRSVTPSTFIYPGAEVHLQYAPEEFGRIATSELMVIDLLFICCPAYARKINHSRP
jgi:hypothetical protein